MLFTVLSTQLLAGEAQQKQQSNPLTKQELKEKRTARRAEFLTERHQFRLNVYGAHIKFSAMPEANVRQENFSLPPFSVEYSFRVYQFLEVGLGVGYCLNSHKTFYDVATNQKSGFDNNESLTITLNLRYSWFNRRWVSLYSSLGLWADCAFMNSSQNGFRRHTQLYPEVVPIGVRVGRKFFGYFEPIGFSARGMFAMCGIGYRF